MRIKRDLCILAAIGYLAGIYNGRIAFWCGEDPEPETVLPYYASLLPDADRTALENGIRIHSHEELIQFMEDFCS